MKSGKLYIALFALVFIAVIFSSCEAPANDDAGYPNKEANKNPPVEIDGNSNRDFDFLQEETKELGLRSLVNGYDSMQIRIGGRIRRHQKGTC